MVLPQSFNMSEGFVWISMTFELCCVPKFIYYTKLLKQ